VKLVDLRRLAVRKQVRIHFHIANGMECVVDEHGIARVPQLKRSPDFNLEQELASAREFLLDHVTPADPKKPAKPRSLTRQELADLTDASPSTGAATHEEE